MNEGMDYDSDSGGGSLYERVNRPLVTDEPVEFEK